MGTDLLIIEKEGVVQVLTPFADKKGIALLNTRGFLTEYAQSCQNFLLIIAVMLLYCQILMYQVCI